MHSETARSVPNGSTARSGASKLVNALTILIHAFTPLDVAPDIAVIVGQKRGPGTGRGIDMAGAISWLTWREWRDGRLRHSGGVRAVRICDSSGTLRASSPQASTASGWTGYCNRLTGSPIHPAMRRRRMTIRSHFPGEFTAGGAEPVQAVRFGTAAGCAVSVFVTPRPQSCGDRRKVNALPPFDAGRTRFES